MKPTLKEIEDNYERVLLQMENGHLAGIRKVYSLDCYNVVEQYDWFNHGIHAIELAKGYERKSAYGHNIDRIKFLSDRNEVDNFLKYEECEIDWDWDINNPHNSKFKWVFHDESSLELYEEDPSIIQLRQMSGYIDDCIAQAVVNKETTINTFNIKGDNNNMINGILDIYGYRRRKKIDKKYEQSMELTKLADERYAIFKDCSDKLDKLYKEDGVITNHLVEPRLAETTLKHLEKLAELREEEYCDLENLISEVHAQLSMCETYEQKQNVLNNYKILKSNGKINA